MKVPSVSPSTPAASPTMKAPARAADGDYKVKSASTSSVKDSDGDYKPSSAASRSSSSTLAALTNIKPGG